MNEKNITDDFELIIKSPRTKKGTENYYDIEGEIGRIHDEEIFALMEKATEALNSVLKWSDSTRRDEIKNMIAGMNKKQIRDKVKEDINECKNTYDTINQKVEEIFGEMKDVEITTTEMGLINGQKIINNLFQKF